MIRTLLKNLSVLRKLGLTKLADHINLVVLYVDPYCSYFIFNYCNFPPDSSDSLQKITDLTKKRKKKKLGFIY